MGHAAGEEEHGNDFEGRQRAYKDCGGHKKTSVGFWGESVAAGQFGEVDGQPAVVREVVELDLAE